MDKRYGIKQILVDVLKGAAIGVANIIPGVSGGTMALVLGIYERLISAIKNISLNTFKAIFAVLSFKKEKINAFKEEMKRIDAAFLAVLAFGAIATVVALASLMTYLLENWHEPTYGFFFGLVAVSILVPLDLIKKKTWLCLLIAMISIGIVVGLSFTISGESMIEKAEKKQAIKLAQEQSGESGTENLSALRAIYLFIAGGITISAMILPGISGSFLLLLMGAYFDILKAVTDRNLAVLGIFILGCLFGILLFTRFINFLLERWYDGTMSFLLGLVVGSLWAIWPFKSTAQVGSETIYLSNIIPQSFSNTEVWTVIAAVAGGLIVWLFIWLDKKYNQTSS
ncbi:MAG: DUF368 domain-containing protein [Acidobacteria bacterium]|nr:DUF368 domain-containing protein [Acidobacteriota bacterium]